MSRKNKRNLNNFYDKPKKKRKQKDDVVMAKFVEVTIEQVRGDTSKMIKKFMRKVRKEEVLKPYYDRLAYHKTKSQKRRQQKLRGVFLHKKRREEELKLEKEAI